MHYWIKEKLMLEKLTNPSDPENEELWVKHEEENCLLIKELKEEWITNHGKEK